MQPGRTTSNEPLTHLRDDIQTKSANGSAVIAKAGKLETNPARYLRATHVRKTHELRVIGNGHDAGNDRCIDTGFLYLINETEIRIRIVKILRDRRVGTRFDLASEVLQIILW